MNYNASQVGVPFLRAYGIRIDYPDAGQPPVVVVEQAMAVKLADGTVRKLEDVPPLNITIDLVNEGVVPIALINPDDNTPLGPNTTLQSTFLSILAIIRKNQVAIYGV
jgi:hypothetical protein